MGDFPLGMICRFLVVLKVEDTGLFLPLSKIEGKAKSFLISVELSLGFWSVVLSVRRAIYH